jgi:hypothetical protein
MDHAPEYILSQYFIDEGILTEPGQSGIWEVFVGLLPDDEVANGIPDDIVAIIGASDNKDGRIMKTGESIIHEGIQLMVRAVNYNTGWAKAKSLRTAMDGIKRDTVTISGSDYRIDSVTIASGPVAIGQEDSTKRRELFSLNVLVTLKEI